jgi:hypothetical protein
MRKVLAGAIGVAVVFFVIALVSPRTANDIINGIADFLGWVVSKAED